MSKDEYAHELFGKLKGERWETHFSFGEKSESIEALLMNVQGKSPIVSSHGRVDVIVNTNGGSWDIQNVLRWVVS